MTDRPLSFTTYCGLCLLVVFAAACDHKSPTAPDLVPPAGPKPQSMVITGQTSLDHPGETSQLTAVVSFSDGTTLDVTNSAVWSWQGGSWPPVSANKGLVVAYRYGRCQVRAQYTGQAVTVAATVSVSVMPEGAFLVAGKVTEHGFAIEAARVTATSAAGVLTAASRIDGSYTLAARGGVAMRVEKEGFNASVRQLTADADISADFDIERVNAPGDIRGVYTVTIAASPSCTTLPAEAVTRIYTARLTTATDGLMVELSGGDFGGFFLWGFIGTREGDVARFTLSADPMDDFACIERLDSSRLLTHSGTGTATIRDRSIIGTLNGEIAVATNRVKTASCVAADHRIEFLR